MTLCTYSNTFNENIQLIDICSRTRDLSLVVVGWKAPGSKRHKDNVKGMNIFAHLHPSHLEALETSWGEVVQINALKQAIFKQYRLTFDSFWLAHFMKPKDDKWERTQVAQIQNTYISNTQNKITTSKVARQTRFYTRHEFLLFKRILLTNNRSAADFCRKYLSVGQWRCYKNASRRQKMSLAVMLLLRDDTKTRKIYCGWERVWKHVSNLYCCRFPQTSSLPFRTVTWVKWNHTSQDCTVNTFKKGFCHVDSNKTHQIDDKWHVKIINYVNWSLNL